MLNKKFKLLLMFLILFLEGRLKSETKLQKKAGKIKNIKIYNCATDRVRKFTTYPSGLTSAHGVIDCNYGCIKNKLGQDYRIEIVNSTDLRTSDIIFYQKTKTKDGKKYIYYKASDGATSSDLNCTVGSKVSLYDYFNGQYNNDQTKEYSIIYKTVKKTVKRKKENCGGQLVLVPGNKCPSAPIAPIAPSAPKPEQQGPPLRPEHQGSPRPGQQEQPPSAPSAPSELGSIGDQCNIYVDHSNKLKLCQSELMCIYDAYKGYDTCGECLLNNKACSSRSDGKFFCKRISSINNNGQTCSYCTTDMDCEKYEQDKTYCPAAHNEIPGACRAK